MTLGVAGVLGLKTVGVTQGGSHAQITGTLDAPAVSTENYIGFLQFSTQPIVARPISFTSTWPYNGYQNTPWGSGYSPRVYCEYQKAISVSGQQIRLSSLSRSDSYTPAMYAPNGRIDVYRVTNGVMSCVRTSAIAGANFSVGGSLMDTGNSGRMVEATTYLHKFNDYNRPGVPYWFSVAAINAAGEIGTHSGWITYIPTNTTSGDPSSSTVYKAHSSTPSALAAPTSFAANANINGPGTVDLSWDAVGGAAGYVVYIAYTDPATWPANDYIELANDGGVTVLAGDLIVWRVPVLRLDRDMIATRLYGAYEWLDFVPTTVKDTPYPGRLYYPGAPKQWEYKLWSIDVPKPDPSLGDYYIERRFAPGEEWVEGVFWSGGGAQSDYYVKKTGDVFKLDGWFWANQAISATFTSGQPGETAQNWTTPTSWTEKNFSSSYVGDTASSGSAYDWKLNATAGGSELIIRIAGLKAYNGPDGAFGDFLPAFSVSVSDGMLYRDHSMIKTRPLSYLGTSILGPPGEGGYYGSTLSMQFDACAANNLKVWSQVEWVIPKDDIILITDWLAAHSDGFDTINLEYGNENWQDGSIAAFYGPFPSMTDTATAEVYNSAAVEGLYLSMIYGWMQEADGWSTLEPKLEMNICGQSVSNYGEKVFEEFPDARHVNGAYYIEGWDSGIITKPRETGSTFVNLLGFPILRIEPDIEQRVSGLEAAATAKGKVYGVDVFSDWYEGGPGYQLNGLLGASMGPADDVIQEVVKKSRASAQSNLDAFMLATINGQRPNFFTLAFGDRWKSNRSDGAEYLAWSAVKAAADRLGDFVAHPLLAATDPVTQVGPYEVAQISAYGLQSQADPSHWVLVAMNRAMNMSVLEPYDPDYDAGNTGIASCLIRTTFSSAAACSVFTAGIGNPREHNRYTSPTDGSVGVRLSTQAQVNGAGQSGTTLIIDGLAICPQIGDTFTVAGVSGTYTVTDAAFGTQWILDITPSLASTPADNAAVTWMGVSSGGYYDDPLDVNFDTSWQSATVPADVSRIVINDDLGADAGGLSGGNFLLIELTGVI